MHRVFWAVKRTYWRTWTVARVALRKYAVTPARFDVLQCLANNEGAMAQKGLMKVLGVARSTISETLGKLEASGFVTRGRRERYGRSVRLTERARDVLSEAIAQRMDFDMDVAKAFRWSARWPLRVLVLERLCKQVRVHFGDPRTRLYGWLDYED